MPTVSDMIRELMETQQLSVRKVSARIAEKYGGSAYGYTQQISRILNDPNYDPTLSTVLKILSALNVSFWQLGKEATPPPGPDLHQFMRGLEQLNTDVAELKQGLTQLQDVVAAIAHSLSIEQPSPSQPGLSSRHTPPQN
jgi:transcriptional regulator with XRE-family HTH domain